MAAQLSEEQKNILKQLEELEKDFQYQPISQSYLPNLQKHKSSSPPQPHHQNLQFLQPQLYSLPPQHIQISTRLQQYKKRSSTIISVNNLLHDYNINFKHFQNQRTQLLKLIQQIHNDTSDLINKQTKYIDLANSVKQALDYYQLLDKFQFNWICQINAREMFEDQLQPLLSALTDGIQFFTLNSNYANAKKYLQGLIAAKTKVCSFTKSFLIKLLTKQQLYLMKNIKSSLPKQIQNFYAKSKPKFLLQFLSCFPQLGKKLKDILIPARQSNNQQQSNMLLKKQTEIQQFLLNFNTLSLITYIQKNVGDAYQEVVLKLISYYRCRFHEGFYKGVEVRGEKDGKFEDLFRDVLVQVIFIITCQAAYLQYCFRPCTQLAREYARGTLAKIADLYTNLLVRIAKQPGKNKDPFKICNSVTFVLEQSQKFLRNYSSRQYQTYVIGAVIEQIQSFGTDTLKSTYKKICNKITNELQPVCQNMLPKYKQTSDKKKLTEQIKQFVKTIPNLSYCPSQAEKYMITSLDTLIKSIKEVSNSIQSRMECYVWNIEIFGLIQVHLDKLPYTLVKKELKLDVGETTRMIQRVKSVDRKQNLLQYASDLFSVIKTGVPSLSQLTLDFNTFIKHYSKDLKQKFIKDMIYIYAKNMIQFIQQIREQASQEEQLKKLCQITMVKNLHSSYKLSIQNFISHANKMLELRDREFALFNEGEEILIGLLHEIQEGLLDILGGFYVEASKYCNQVENFDKIGEIRAKFVFMKPRLRNRQE